MRRRAGEDAAGCRCRRQQVPLKGGGRRPGVKMARHHDAVMPRQCGSRGKSADSAAKRRMSAVLPDWSEIDRSVTRSRAAMAS